MYTHLIKYIKSKLASTISTALLPSGWSINLYFSNPTPNEWEWQEGEALARFIFLLPMWVNTVAKPDCTLGEEKFGLN